MRFLPGGRFEVVNAQLTFIIQQVYGMRDFQIVDAPKWISDWATSRFTIEAKAGSPASEDQLRLMAQRLLEDRFQLKIHREVRPLPVYAFRPAKNGVGLKASKDNGRPPGRGGIERVAAGK